MKELSDNPFDEFIRSEMNNLSMEQSREEEWNRLTKSLDKGSFWKFTVNRFNVYYSGAVVTFILTVLYFWLRDTTPNSEQPRQSGSGVDTVYATHAWEGLDSLKLITPKTNKKASNKLSITQSDSIGSTNPDSLLLKKQALKLKQDSINSPAVQNPLQLISKPDSLPKKIPKRIRIVTKRDTIIKADTTIIKRKR